jgi:hypothetical protein
MRIASAFLAILGAVMCLRTADGAEPLPLKVLYVGNMGTPRAVAFEEFLRQQFVEVHLADRAAFEPATAKQVDVVLLDWSQSDSKAAGSKSPVGDREEFSTPMVLLGSAGHLLAGHWEIVGGSG